MNRFTHFPVMLDEVLDAFDPVPAGTIVDATLGGAGHAAAILRRRHDLRVLGIDRDPEAIAAAKIRLLEFGDRSEIHYGRFDALGRIAEETADGRGFSGVLFDLGVSSPQLDEPTRGFSFHHDGPLDMRMDPDAPVTAAGLVNSASEAELATLIAESGEERFARRIAAAIVRARPLSTTQELADVVADAVPVAARRRGHPARRVFQGIRIAVNEELDQLPVAIDAAIDALAPGGRIVVLAYHSGEDRIVKERLRFAATGGCVCPPGLPCVCGARPTVRLLNRGAKKPTAAEIAANPRAESARFRAAERLGADAEERAS